MKDLISWRILWFVGHRWFLFSPESPSFPHSPQEMFFEQVEEKFPSMQADLWAPFHCCSYLSLSKTDTKDSLMEFSRSAHFLKGSAAGLANHGRAHLNVCRNWLHCSPRPLPGSSSCWRGQRRRHLQSGLREADGWLESSVTEGRGCPNDLACWSLPCWGCGMV